MISPPSISAIFETGQRWNFHRRRVFQCDRHPETRKLQLYTINPYKYWKLDAEHQHKQECPFRHVQFDNLRNKRNRFTFDNGWFDDPVTLPAPIVRIRSCAAYSVARAQLASELSVIGRLAVLRPLRRP